MANEAEEFLAAMCPSLPADERMIVCAFDGDPGRTDLSAWKPKPWKPGDLLSWPRHWNGYITVSSFRIAADQTWRRRGDLFAGGHALMIDDIGTKVDASLVKGVTPSAIVETSPGNFQYWYFLDVAERDPWRFDAVIRAFIAGKLLGKDPGMAGITRVGRLPGFYNGKEKYGGFDVRLTELNARAFSVDELVDAFGLQLSGRKEPPKRLPTDEAVERNRYFAVIYKFLQQRRMLKKDEPDMSGWSECTCPWVDDHTGSVDNGAAIAEPSESNGYRGGWRCHHGSCAGRGWKQLTDWVNEQAVEELGAAVGGVDEFEESLK